MRFRPLLSSLSPVALTLVVLLAVGLSASTSHGSARRFVRLSGPAGLVARDAFPTLTHAMPYGGGELGDSVSTPQSHVPSLTGSGRASDAATTADLVLHSNTVLGLAGSPFTGDLGIGSGALRIKLWTSPSTTHNTLHSRLGAWMGPQLRSVGLITRVRRSS